jgi:pimeloyl-ACP methyl ester carboxylesterase
MSRLSRQWSARRGQFAAAAVRSGVGVLQAVAPGIAGNVVERLWFTPPRVPAAVMHRHAELLSDAEPLTLRVNGRDLRGWTLGKGPKVMLVHGWGGWAAQLAPIAEALARSGLSATAIDLPGHGSDRVRRSDPFQMADALRVLADERGVPTVVVAHSLGAMIAALALDAAPPSAAVFLAPALSTVRAIDSFAQALGLRPAAAHDLRSRLQRFTGDVWPLINRGADLDWPGGPLLVVHDRDDPQTPFALSAALAERHDDVDLLEVTGAGHHRMLRDPEIVQAVARFVTAHVATQRV